MTLRIVDNFTVDLNRALSHTQMGTFDRCRTQYTLKYIKKVKPLARDMHLDSWERMTRGTLIHAGGESGFLQEPIEKGVTETADAIRTENELSDAQKAMLPGMVDDSIAVATAALEWLPASDWEPIIHEGKPMVEAKLEMPLAPWKYGWVGYADLIARHKPTGLVFVIDYKSREKFESDGYDQFNTQFPGYVRAIRRLGIECHGSLTFEMKPEPPKRAPKARHEDTGAVTGVRISMDGRFKTTPTLWPEAKVEGVWADVERRASVIARLKPNDIYRTQGGFNCARCDFRSLCMGELEGHDVEDISQENFQVTV